MEILFLILFYFAAYFYWSLKRLKYSHYEQTISELGESGSGVERGVGLSFFLPVGLALAVISWLSFSNQYVSLLAGAMSIGYIGGALFPVDKRAPHSGSWKNCLHNLFGGVEYFGAIAAIRMLKPELGFFSNILQGGIVVFIVGLYIPGLRKFRGLLQRVVEIGLFLALWKVF